MNANAMTKAQLLAELSAAQHRIAALEKSQERHRCPSTDSSITMAFVEALAHSLQGVVVLFGADRLLLWWNVNTENVTGYTASELAGTEVALLVAPEDRSGILWQFEHAMQTGTAEVDARLLTKDGRQIPYRFTGQRILFVGNSSLLCMGSDCSEQALAQQELRHSEARKAAMLEAALDCILTIDHEERILEFNPAAERTFGYSKEQALGQRISDLIIPPRFRSAHRQGMQRYLATGIGPVLSQRIEMTALRADGTEFPAEISIVPIVLDGRHLFTGYLRDISDRRRTEEELQQRVEQQTAELRAANVALERAAQLKGQFLATVSHELRTPLNGVLGMVELLVDTRLDELQQRYAHLARTSAEILRSVINDILDFSRLESGKFVLEACPFNPAEVVTEVASVLALQAEEKNLELACHIGPEVSVWVSGDRGRLQQVLLNLAANALKFTERGRIEITAEVTASDHAEKSSGAAIPCAGLRFCVTDTGIGIPADQLDRLFKPFSQVDPSLTRRFGGSGLGLAICRDLTELMGGQIGVESRAGAGSAFWFTVRVPRADRPDPALAHSHRGSVPARSLSVLVAEDNEANQLVAATLLQKAGHSVRVVANGRDAVEAFSQEPVDVILMDLQMPELDGLQATQEIRRLEPPGKRVRIIGLTAHARRGEHDRALASGMDAYLAKPFSRQEFEHVLSGSEDEQPGAKTHSAESLATALPVDCPPALILDRAAILARLEGAEQLLLELIRVSRREWPPRLAALRHGLDAGDPATASFQAHQLVGLARHFDAVEAVAAAERIESCGTTADLDGMRSGYGEVAQQFNRLDAALDALERDLEQGLDMNTA
jgi:PAS domain S-box-containing protein